VISRRGLLVSGAAAGLAVALGGETALGLGATAHSGIGSDEVPGNDDLWLVNGRIHTMDPTRRIVSQVVIRHGRFVEVGTDPASPRPGRRIDLGGRTVVPGLVDAHTHIALAGNRPGFHQPLDDAGSLAAVLELLAARRPSVPEGQFITCVGLVNTMHIAERRLPTRAELDDAVPDRPIYLQPAFDDRRGPALLLTGAVTNSLGRQWLAARGVMADDSGNLDPAAMQQALFHLRREFLTPEARRRGALDALRHYTSRGTTTIVDAGAVQRTGTPADTIMSEDNYRMHDPFLALHADGALPCRYRMNFLHLDADATGGLEAQRQRLKNAFPFFGDEWVKTGGIGEFSAGSLVGDRMIAAAGWRNENHTYVGVGCGCGTPPGDVEQILRRWEAVNADVPITGLRWTMSHLLPDITGRQLERAKALGVGLLIGVGPTFGGPPSRRILDCGIPVGFHTDSGDIVPSNPFVTLWFLVTGQNFLGETINPGQQISRQEALETATCRNRWFLNDEPLGSVQPGFYGDLVVLDRDYFRVPEDEIRFVRPVLTVVGGRVAHDAGLLASASFAGDFSP
jgi:predicted amidohydrolase YtcJ